MCFSGLPESSQTIFHRCVFVSCPTVNLNFSLISNCCKLILSLLKILSMSQGGFFGGFDFDSDRKYRYRCIWRVLPIHCKLIQIQIHFVLTPRRKYQRGSYGGSFTVWVQPPHLVLFIDEQPTLQLDLLSSIECPHAGMCLIGRHIDG